MKIVKPTYANYRKIVKKLKSVISKINTNYQWLKMAKKSFTYIDVFSSI